MEILCCPCCGQLGQVLLTQQEYADRFGKPPTLALPSGQAAEHPFRLLSPAAAADGGRAKGAGTATPGGRLEVWPESHWPGFALRQADVLQSYTA